MGNLPSSKSHGPTFTNVAVLKLKVHKTSAKIKDIFSINANFEINPLLFRL